MPSAFLLTDKQVQQLKLLPQQIVEHHVQVLNHEGRFYHLNPDLVFDVNEIVLCPICAEDPMIKNEESIAAGNDYGRLASEAAPCPLQPCYFDKWDIFADTWDCQYALGLPVCIFNNLLLIFPISCHLLMSE